MARSIDVPTHERPPTPGEMLAEEFLKPLGITQRAFASHIRISLPRLNEIINGHRGVTPDTALRFERATGMSATFWLNLQQMVDLYDAIHSEAAREVHAIRRLKELKSA
jgi:addiction module HigA family antidote